MTTISIHNRNIITEVDSAIIGIRNIIAFMIDYTGLIGLLISTPLILGGYFILCGILSLRVKFFFRNVIAGLHKYSDRELVEFELQLSRFEKDNVEKIAAILRPMREIAPKNAIVRLFLSRTDKLLNLITTNINQISAIVYPKGVNPVNDPVFIKRLQKAYEGHDMSDWEDDALDVYELNH